MTLKQIYVNKFKKLIEKERKHEIEFHRNEIKKLGRKREDVGRAILNLDGKIKGEIFGEYIVRYGRREPFKKLDISTGDVVLISKYDPLASDLLGNVVEVGKNYIDVSLENIPKWALKNVRIDLYINDITFKRMVKALDTFEKLDTRLTNIVLGIEEPKYTKRDISVKFFDDNLNKYQKEAVKNALKSFDIYLIHGPPGTGKTRTISEVILQECNRKNKVLATADSNIAVDNILTNLSKYEDRFNIVRIGHPTRISKELIKHSLYHKITEHKDYNKIKSLKEEIKKLVEKRNKFKKPNPKWRRGLSDDEIIIFSKLDRDIRGVPKEIIKKMAEWIKINERIRHLRELLEKTEKEIVNDILTKSDIIVATNSMAGSEVLEGFKFDVCVIDEGSQSMEPSSLIPIVKSQKVIISGDHKQLPPTVLSEEEELKQTLFERMINLYSDFSSILQIQYRMNEKIMKFSNEMFYENKLKPYKSVRKHNIMDLIKDVETDEEDIDIINEDPIIFIDVRGEEKRDDFKSYYNEEEAKKVVEVVSKLRKYNIPVSVITPYDAQVKYLSKMLKDDEIEVKSVDGFQGREEDAIVISFVRTEKFGFLKDLRRLNVAVTRAKRKLIVIGCRELLTQDSTYNKFLKYCKIV
ncbi:IGHMBP2 family helicase [Methanothermococcus thermolithotrophicus]|jgi:predicted DNA helicase|uniref:IGHMBP2 family helicase n=1 Tax=Methanothermococcus thermolithotrophicus TaxID=2186 RepID=UPI00037E35F2|nr:IGHMBP2 family helicase [Methanothermococcus thermolithotrophicus]MDK2987915.1 hypothetical protein [Methanothermococcus sp.]